MLHNKQISVILRSILIFVFLSGMFNIVAKPVEAQAAISPSAEKSFSDAYTTLEAGDSKLRHISFSDRNVEIDNAQLTNYLINGIDNPRAMFGFSVNSAGDVNGDGFDDVIIGARDYWEGEVEEGAAFLYLGSSSGDFNTPAWSVQSNQSVAGMGQSVDTAGDVNGDGYDDILVGAPQYNAGQTSEGAVFAYYGSPNGPSITPNWIGQADQANAAYGWSVSDAGDVNKDGYDDVIVGSRYYSNGESHEGKAFLYLGSATGLSSTPAWSKEINIQNAGFGYSVSNAGDVNTDGYSDVLVTSYNYIYGQLNGGKAYLFLGGPTGLATNASWVGESSIPMDGYGQIGSDAGDVNGDGYSDILIGAPGGDNDAVAGKAYLYFGSANGPSQQPDWFAQGTTTGLFGMSLASAGDYNHDGYDDILVGDEIYYTYPSIGGAVFLYLGGSSGPGTSPYLSYTSGVNNSAFAASVGSAGRFNGDAYDDFLVGAPMWTRTPYGGGVTMLFFGQCTSSSITVTNTNDTGAGSLRQAIVDICPGGTVNFASSLSGQTITLASGITIGKDLTIDASSLSANIKLDGNSSIQGLLGVSNGISATMKNIDFLNAQFAAIGSDGVLQVKNSSFSGNVLGISNSGTLNVDGSTFINNGRGIYNEKISGSAADVTITKSTFTQNQLSAVYNKDGTLTITESSFLNNESDYGGAVHNTGIMTTISNTHFEGNHATGNGGAINGGPLNITNSTFLKNTADNSGGAIFGDGVITGSTFTANTAGNTGGAISALIQVTISNSTFSYNSTTGNGGAIYHHLTSTLLTSDLTNNTFSGNLAGDKGGGIYNDSTLLIVNNTFSGNSASSGGSMYNANGRNLGDTYYKLSDLYVYNSILASSTSGTDCYNETSTVINVKNNLIENNSGSPNNCGGSISSADPQLEALADNGGFTQTMALLPGSPAINAGDDGSCPETDQRGVSRPQGSHCDIGAYEYRSSPTIYYVKQGASGVNNGSSWANAYTNLQSALAVASNGDEIWVAAGTYKPTTGIDRTISFTLKNGVAIYGGFAGTESLLSERDYAKNITILSGDIGVANDNSDNSYHVVVASSVDNNTIVDGFTITGGNANGIYPSPYDSGGGMYSDKGSLKLNHIIFADNYATIRGGGLYTFYTDGEGQAVDLDLTGVVFNNNTAGGDGGGMSTLFYPFQSATFSVSLTDVIFTNNVSARTGGGMSNVECGLTLLDVTFSDNTALGGGGLSDISFPNGLSTLTNVTFSNNSADEGGGGMLIGSDGGTPTTLTNVTFDHNSTAINGGGIVNAGDSHLILTNVTFSENTADANGSGIFNGEFAYVKGGGTIDLMNTTFSHNVSNANGSAIYNEIGNVNVHNSILYGDSGGEIYGTASVTYSIIQGGYTGTGNLNVAPLLGQLQDNGGFTQTMALSSNSPAINAGDDSNCPETDQRGVARPQGSHCDIGAYEYEPQTRYVKWNANGTNNGTSWTNAYTDLQSALAASSSGDEIWVAAGTYKPTTGTDRSISFTLKSGVAIYGGFAGTETSRAQRNYETNITVLSGDIGAQADKSDNSYHVVMDSKADLSTVLDGFAITAGNANVPDYWNQSDKGGGMFNDRGSPTISNMIFINNYADFGGGIYSGDIYNLSESSNPVLTNVKFIGNSAREGGGMENQFYSSPTLTNVVFSNNTATRSGGGLLNYHSSNPTLLNVAFNENTAFAGGGIMNYEGSNPNLTDFTFYANAAGDWGGGGMANSGSNPTITNGTFYANIATKYGGAIYDEGNSNPTLINLTLSGNSAAISGGGIYNNSSIATVRNSILYGNSGGEIYDGGLASLVSYSIIQGGYSGTGNLSADPKLGALADNGGFTQTMALSSDSPAINAGDDSNCPETDQRGVSRPQGSHCDIGAYEYEHTSTIYDDTDTHWSYTGSWKTYSGSGPHNNTLHYTSKVGNTASFIFTGTQFTLSYTQNTNRGSFEVSVDGSKIATVNANGALQWQKKFTSPIFSTGTHVVQFKNIGGSGTIMDVDAIEVLDTPIPDAGKYDDSDSWFYSGKWVSYSGSGPYNSTLHYTSKVGNTALFTFTGTQFILSYTQNTNRGSFDVYVDGSKITTINAHGVLQWQKTFTSPIFAVGTHTVQLRNIGGSGSIADVDAIEILDTPVPGAGTYDDNENWFYTGTWLTFSGSGPYKGTLHYTRTVGNTARFTFTGTQFILSYTQNTNRGKFEVYVDGNKVATINANGTLQWQKNYVSPTFTAGTHVVQVKNIGGTGNIIDVDAIEIN